MAVPQWTVRTAHGVIAVVEKLNVELEAVARLHIALQLGHGSSFKQTAAAAKAVRAPRPANDRKSRQLEESGMLVPGKTLSGNCC